MKKIVATLALSTLLFSGSLLAQDRFTDFGRVLHAQPVYKTIRISNHRHNHCNDNHRYERYSQHNRRQSSNAPVVGAVVGGIIGNKLGKGNKRVLTTVAGSIAGAAIASNHSKDHYRHGSSKHQRHDRYKKQHRPSRHQRHCDSFHRERHSRRVLKGYDVTYRYKGEIFHTFTRHHPGKRIRLDVNIRPLDH